MNRWIIIAWALASSTVACNSVPPDVALLERVLEARSTQVTGPFLGAARTEQGNLLGLPYRARTTFQTPLDLAWEFEIEGFPTSVSQFYDGEKRIAVAITETGEEQELPPEIVRVLRQRALDEAVFWLEPLTDPNLTTRIPEQPIPFRGREVDSLLVEHWTGYSRMLHFDPETGDLVGHEGLTWTDFAAERVMTQVVFDEFEEIAGRRVPRAFQVYRDDEMVVEGRNVDFRFLEAAVE